MAFESLITIDSAKPKVEKHASSAKHKKSSLGCDNCPSKMNWKEWIRPVFGQVTGKKIFVWAQNPGHNENKEGQELVGKSGEWLWRELKRVGITRDQCDIQNVVRCYTVDYQDVEWPSLKM